MPAPQGFFWREGARSLIRMPRGIRLRLPCLPLLGRRRSYRCIHCAPCIPAGAAEHTYPSLPLSPSPPPSSFAQLTRTHSSPRSCSEGAVVRNTDLRELAASFLGVHATNLEAALRKSSGDGGWGRWRAPRRLRWNTRTAGLLLQRYISCSAAGVAGAHLLLGLQQPLINSLFSAHAITIQAHPRNENTIVAQQPVKLMRAPSTRRKGTIRGRGAGTTATPFSPGGAGEDIPEARSSRAVRVRVERRARGYVPKLCRFFFTFISLSLRRGK
ncbi:hypothetical protein C8F04DRAFT_1278718 [Mycena alexandri]|uniref:Uncharacterized protein n=1 Tax=Mycena alexandri TaxID=1745969 RepID=A0AAD6WR33_9AGAR|nr:hypothetical protein C8F04DRAFT_1278718 [Mycena alexandri]